MRSKPKGFRSSTPFPVSSLHCAGASGRAALSGRADHDNGEKSGQSCAARRSDVAMTAQAPAETTAEPAVTTTAVAAPGAGPAPVSRGQARRLHGTRGARLRAPALGVAVPGRHVEPDLPAGGRQRAALCAAQEAARKAAALGPCGGPGIPGDLRACRTRMSRWRAPGRSARTRALSAGPSTSWSMSRGVWRAT